MQTNKTGFFLGNLVVNTIQTQPPRNQK